MRYIIDANNLAGQLGILREDDFDQKLIEIIKQWLGKRKSQVFLVFDSADPMGDKQVFGNLTVIYTPKDNYYQSADDKILELVEAIHASPLQVITDDRDLIKAIEKISEKIDNEIKILLATVFAKKLKPDLEKKENNHEDGQRGLSGQEIRKINNELRKIWQ